MSGPIQMRPISSAAARAAIKREKGKAVAPSTAPSNNLKPPPSHSETPVEPAAAADPATHLNVARDDTANAFVFQSIDSATGEVVWQYPVEQVLRLAHRLRELEGLDEHKVDEKI